MRKLMTVMASLATAAFAVGTAHADLTSVTFEETPYVAGQDLNINLDDNGVAASETAAVWAGTLESGAATVTAYTSDDDPYDGSDYGNNYLKLETTAELERFAQAGGDPLDIGDGLYIDTLVQFTAAEEAPTPDTSAGDKICIWLQADSEDSAADGTLIVTAGYPNHITGAVVDTTNYVTTTKLAPNSWHRLQVKVLKTIGTKLGDGFVVFVDNVAVATSSSTMNTNLIAASTLTPRAAKYFGADAGVYSLFPSLLPKTDGDTGTITSLSFKGSGSVDNISFTQGADIDPILVDMPVAHGNFTYDGTEKVGITYNEDLEGVAFETTVGSVVAATAVGEYSATFTMDSDDYVGYAWADGSTTNLTYSWSIAAGGDQPGYDNGDGDSGKFTIDATMETLLTAKLPTGKSALSDTVDGMGSLTYAQAYALGLWDETAEEVAELEATISIGADGKVTVKLANEPATGYTITCKVYEKENLTDAWPTEATATYDYGAETAITPSPEAAAGFYKVAIEINNATAAE